MKRRSVGRTLRFSAVGMVVALLGGVSSSREGDGVEDAAKHECVDDCLLLVRSRRSIGIQQHTIPVDQMQNGCAHHGAERI